MIQPLLRSTLRMEGMARYLRGLKWGPVDALEQAHARITMPVQLIWGADDPTFPVEYARRMVKQLPDARLVEIPGGRLLVHEEEPAEVAHAALDFLG